MNSLPKTVTRQRRGCDLNPDPTAPESSTIATRLPSHANCTPLIMLSVLSSQKNHLAAINRKPTSTAAVYRSNGHNRGTRNHAVRLAFI